MFKIMKWISPIMVVMYLALGASCQVSQPVLSQFGPTRLELSHYCKSDNTPFILMDNTSARDISYTELLAFLDTFKPKVLPSKTCGHYAEELHNYSENHWVRCAIVIENYSTASTHAFNGFLTDGKMTYVDAGEGIISIAIKDDTGLKFVKDRGDQVQTQAVGQEQDFLIFWEAK